MRRRPALTAASPVLLGAPVAWLMGLPPWCQITLLALWAPLGTARVLVTQRIRLRASTHLIDPRHALRVLEIEDLPHPQRRR